MKKWIGFTIAIVFLLPAIASAGHTHFAWVNGHQEVAPTTSTAEGCGTFELIGSDLYYELQWSGLSAAVTGAHIHAAPLGINGGVVHPLQNLTQTSARGVWSGLSLAELSTLSAHGLYVNVHTTNWPGGEIRGQILLEGTKIAIIEGAQETPPVVTPGRGFGWFQLSGDQSSLSYWIAWDNLLAPETVTGGHLHLGIAGAPGGVVHPLQNLGSNAALGSWALSAQNVVQLEAESLYVNIHTTNYGGGEIRGQIICPCIPSSANFDASDIGESLCMHLCPDKSSRIRVFNVADGDYPTVTKRFGCQEPCEVDCEPTTYLTEIFSTWQITGGVFWLELRGDGCLCVTLDGILPVELSSFTAVANEGRVDVSWTTASETDNDYFEIARDGETMARIEATNNASGHSYSWSDRAVVTGSTYEYALFAIDFAGNREALASERVTTGASQGVVSAYALHQNFPNPFNPETSISFDLAAAGYAEVAVFNTVGQRVASLAAGYMEAGSHAVTFDAAGLPSGLYFYQLTAGDFSALRKMVLLK